jgi:hypothetical protein
MVTLLLPPDYQNVAVLDVSSAAINFTKNRLGQVADSVQWIVGDIMLHVVWGLSGNEILRGHATGRMRWQASPQS